MRLHLPFTTRRTPTSRHRRTALAAAAAVVLVMSVATPASAAVIWDGDESGGTAVFGTNECPSPGELTVESDADRDYFRFQKSVGTYRCEVRGVEVDGANYEFSEGNTYWLGWDQNFGFTSEGPEGDWVNWQWKGYPNTVQAYPLLMRVNDGRLYLVYVTPTAQWKTIWSTPVQAGQWNSVSIGIHTSSSETDGWVKLFYNGEKQTFTDGSTKYYGATWDSDNEPKWGAYDRGNTAYEIVNNVSDLRIGTKLADVYRTGE